MDEIAASSSPSGPSSETAALTMVVASTLSIELPETVSALPRESGDPGFFLTDPLFAGKQKRLDPRFRGEERNMVCRVRKSLTKTR